MNKCQSLLKLTENESKFSIGDRVRKNGTNAIGTVMAVIDGTHCELEYDDGQTEKVAMFDLIKIGRDKRYKRKHESVDLPLGYYVVDRQGEVGDGPFDTEEEAEENNKKFFKDNKVEYGISTYNGHFIPKHKTHESVDYKAQNDEVIHALKDAVKSADDLKLKLHHIMELNKKYRYLAQWNKIDDIHHRLDGIKVTLEYVQRDGEEDLKIRSGG